MDEQQPKARQILHASLAVILWLITFGLGLESIYDLLQIFYLVFGSLGGNMVKAERYALGLVFILGLFFMLFLIGTAEYHRKRVGTRESWRLFGWTIAVELSIITLRYILI
jgi:hypothetical protein